MTEPKYHKIVAGMISDKEKNSEIVKEDDGKSTRYALSPLKKGKLSLNKNYGNFNEFA